MEQLSDMRQKLIEELKESIFNDQDLINGYKNDLRHFIVSNYGVQICQQVTDQIRSNVVNRPKDDPIYSQADFIPLTSIEEAELDKLLANSKKESSKRVLPASIDRPLSALTSSKKDSKKKSKKRTLETTEKKELVPIFSKKQSFAQAITGFCGDFNCRCRYTPFSPSDRAATDHNLISTVRIYITDLPKNIEMDKLRIDLGEVCLGCQTFPKKTYINVHGNYAILKFPDHQTAVRAFEFLSDLIFHGSKLQVNFFRK